MFICIRNTINFTLGSFYDVPTCDYSNETKHENSRNKFVEKGVTGMTLSSIAEASPLSEQATKLFQSIQLLLSLDKTTNIYRSEQEKESS